MGIQSVMLAIVQHEDVEAAMRALVGAGLKVTCISSIGGFLRAGNVTLLLGLARADVPTAIQLLSKHCRKRTAYVNAEPFVPTVGITHFITPVEVQVGGATVFVLPIEQFVRIDEQRKEFAFEPNARGANTMDMKLILAIVPEELANGIMDTLIEAKYSATLISTTGGLLRKGNATLLIGVQAGKADDAIQRIERYCVDTLATQTVADPATSIFVLDVERYESIGMEPTPANATEIKSMPASA